MAAVTPPNPALPALPNLAGGEDGAVAWVQCEQWVGRARPLELFVCKVPVIRVINENTPQRRLGPATLRRDIVECTALLTVTCCVCVPC